MHNEVWIYTEILPLTVPYSGVRASSPFSRVCCTILNPFFGTQCRKSNECWNNRCILGYVWIASIVPVMREWFPFSRLQTFTIAPIVRIELEAIQAIVIAPIVRVVSVVSVVFHMIVPIAWSYFETTGTIGAIGTIIWKAGFMLKTKPPFVTGCNKTSGLAGS